MNERAEARRLFFKYWFPVVAFSGLIIVASAMPVQIKPVPIRNWDKWVHAGEYAVLSWLWFRAIRGTTLIYNPYKAGVITFLICCSFGFFDEGFQSLIPNRVSDFKDVLADATGSLAAVTVAIIKSRVLRT